MVDFRRRSLLAAAAVAAFILFAAVSSFNYPGNGGVNGRFPARKLLMGSSPPSCRSKCGRCGPCKAVHVAIQPGFVIPLEYYPEAWRCKCGNKLYMP